MESPALTLKPPGIEGTSLLLAVVEGDDYWLLLGVSLESALTRERMEEARALAKVLLAEPAT